MSEEEKKRDALAIIPSNGLVKVNRSLQITESIIDKSHKRQFELERAHFDTVRIGNQEWMAKNLDVTYFRNGDLIPEIRDNEEWKQAGLNGKPAWCYYENDPERGKLYNWCAVSDQRGLAPSGWHVSSEHDFISIEKELWPDSDSDINVKQLTDSIKGYLKTVGIHNLTSGIRNDRGLFLDNGICFWRSNNGTVHISLSHSLYYHVGGAYDGPGFSVRCVRDKLLVR